MLYDMVLILSMSPGATHISLPWQTYTLDMPAQDMAQWQEWFQSWLSLRTPPLKLKWHEIIGLVTNQVVLLERIFNSKMDKNTWHQFCFRETLFVFLTRPSSLDGIKSCMAFTLRIQARICQILRLVVISITRRDETAKAPIILTRCDSPPSSSKFSDPIPASAKR